MLVMALENIWAPAPLPVPSNHIHIPEVHKTANWSSYVSFTAYSKSDLKPLSKRWNDFNNVLVSYMFSIFPHLTNIEILPQKLKLKT